MSKQVRIGFAKLAQRKCNVSLDPENLEVFVEAAALRDYWRELGDPVDYFPETHEGRKAVLKKIFEKYHLPEDILDKHDLFWTSTKKLWNPNHWNEKALAEAGLKELIKVKWAFNAKPDILLVSPESMLVIEAKVESGEGCKADTDYRQLDVQELIIDLWKLLIPEFAKREIRLALLNLSGTHEKVPVIKWSEIIDLISGSDVDAFTRNAIAQLNDKYKK
ncbi:MAG: hypothetical protein HGA59_04290 [Chlorobiaceae bacterium]|nr:hypothetical protein [Chlorobiaceae bacterium]